MAPRLSSAASKDALNMSREVEFVSQGCTNQVVKGGVCVTHGAKLKQCSLDGCTNNAKKGGLCYRHRSKITNANNNSEQPPNVVPLAVPARQLVNFDDEEELNSWIWRSCPTARNPNM